MRRGNVVRVSLVGWLAYSCLFKRNIINYDRLVHNVKTLLFIALTAKLDKARIC